MKSLFRLGSVAIRADGLAVGVLRAGVSGRIDFAIGLQCHHAVGAGHECVAGSASGRRCSHLAVSPCCPGTTNEDGLPAWRARMCGSCITVARTGVMAVRGARQRTVCVRWSRSASRSPICPAADIDVPEPRSTASAAKGIQVEAWVNPYRVMVQAGLLLPNAPRQHHSSRRREGSVSVAQQSALMLRWAVHQARLRGEGDEHVRQGFL